MHNLYVFIVKFVNTGCNLANISWRFGQYRLAIWSIPVCVLANTRWRFGQYRLVLWPIRVGDFANTGWGFGQNRLVLWPILVGDLTNTGWRYRRRYIFQGLGRFKVEIGDSKNMGGLRIMLIYEIKNKKNRFCYRRVPLI